MKRISGISKSQLYSMLLLACVMLLSGCGTNINEKQESSIQKIEAEDVQGNTQEEINETSQERVQEGKSPSKMEVEETVRNSVVRIEGDRFFGSGVIWEIGKEYVRILSCRHVLEINNTCDIIFPTGVYYKATVEFLSEEYDYGFAVIPASEMDLEDISVLETAKPSKRTRGQMIKGEEVLAYGSSEYAASDTIWGYVVDTDVMANIPGLFAEQSMMVCHGQITPGMSGCGIFDESGALIGILSGGEKEQVEHLSAEDEYPVFVAVPIWHIT